MRKSAAFTLILAAAACTPSPPASVRPAALSPAWLAGGWVPQGENCASEAGIIYRSDGRWFADGAAGTWRIAGDRIVSSLTERWEDGVAVERIASPASTTERIQVTGPDSYVSRHQDGAVFRMGRCPSSPD